MIRTRDVTIIRLRESHATGQPYDSSDEADVECYAIHRERAADHLLAEGDENLSEFDPTEDNEAD